MNRYVKTGLIVGSNFILILLFLVNFSAIENDFSVGILAEESNTSKQSQNIEVASNKTYALTIESMKNILLGGRTSSSPQKPASINVNIEETTIDLNLAEALTDSSEIDLSPPNPVIIKEIQNISSLDQFRQEMTARRKRLNKKCLTKKSRQILNNRVFYALPSRWLVWCPVFKAASTNWMHNLLHLAGRSEEEINRIVQEHPRQPNDQARVVAPILAMSKLREMSSSEKYKSFLVVRHPFDRLVSAFRNKLERCHGKDRTSFKGEWYYNSYGKKIVKKYRQLAIQRFGPDFFSAENNFGSPFPISSGWRTNQLPSWWEFVQYLLSTAPTRYDEHWKPTSIYCAVCSFKFTHILHFENIEQEERYFAEDLGASNVVHPRWENRNDDGISKEEMLNRYFSLLDDDEIQALYRLYQDDFALFGFEFEYRGLKLNSH